MGQAFCYLLHFKKFFAAKDDPEKLNLLVADMEKQAKKRRNFSRRRATNPNQDVTYINDRNKIYNQKL